MRKRGKESWLRLCPIEDSGVSSVKSLGPIPEPPIIIVPILCLTSEMEVSTRQKND